MTVTTECPVCHTVLYCPCPECRKTEPADALHFQRDPAYIFIDVIYCEKCGYLENINRWEMKVHA